MSMPPDHGRDAASRAGEAWRVLRRDDNGNEFVVATGLSSDEAQALVLEYESRGHKQVYWAAPDPNP